MRYPTGRRETYSVVKPPKRGRRIPGARVGRGSESITLTYSDVGLRARAGRISPARRAMDKGRYIGLIAWQWMRSSLSKNAKQLNGGTSPTTDIHRMRTTVEISRVATSQQRDEKNDPMGDGQPHGGKPSRKVGTLPECPDPPGSPCRPNGGSRSNARPHGRT
jgi:hypothetical protein